MSDYKFSNAWFERDAKLVWDQLIPRLNPGRILEIGSYEGASLCYLIDKLSNRFELEIHCIDTWEGGVEHQSADVDMSSVERRFQKNLEIAKGKFPGNLDVHVHKGPSDELLIKIAQSKQKYFDFIYVDGSHQASDVMFDALMSFKLLRVGGVICFDDYLWSERLSYGKDPMRCPKISIDFFTNIFFRKTEIIRAPLYQLFVRKISD